MSGQQRQLAITKTPPLHGTYCVRLRTKDGGYIEYLSTRALTFDELIFGLTERIADVERCKEIYATAEK